MNKNLRFVKLASRWLIDIPYNGNINDLEMVLGADEMLQHISDNTNGDDTVYIEVSDFLRAQSGHDAMITKTKGEDMGEGQWYDFAENYALYSNAKTQKIWLCDVTKLVFGGFPETLYIKYKK